MLPKILANPGNYEPKAHRIATAERAKPPFSFPPKKRRTPRVIPLHSVILKEDCASSKEMQDQEGNTSVSKRGASAKWRLFRGHPALDTLRTSPTHLNNPWSCHTHPDGTDDDADHILTFVQYVVCMDCA